MAHPTPSIAAIDPSLLSSDVRPALPAVQSVWNGHTILPLESNHITFTVKLRGESIVFAKLAIRIYAIVDQPRYKLLHINAFLKDQPPLSNVYRLEAVPTAAAAVAALSPASVEPSSIGVGSRRRREESAGGAGEGEDAIAPPPPVDARRVRARQDVDTDSDDDTRSVTEDSDSDEDDHGRRLSTDTRAAAPAYPTFDLENTRLRQGSPIGPPSADRHEHAAPAAPLRPVRRRSPLFPPDAVGSGGGIGIPTTPPDARRPAAAGGGFVLRWALPMPPAAPARPASAETVGGGEETLPDIRLTEGTSFSSPPRAGGSRLVRLVVPSNASLERAAPPDTDSEEG